MTTRDLSEYGFSFDFYGRTYDQVYVSKEGILSFGAEPMWTGRTGGNAPLDESVFLYSTDRYASYGGNIAVLWDSLELVARSPAFSARARRSASTVVSRSKRSSLWSIAGCTRAFSSKCNSAPSRGIFRRAASTIATASAQPIATTCPANANRRDSGAMLCRRRSKTSSRIVDFA